MDNGLAVFTVVLKEPEKAIDLVQHIFDLRVCIAKGERGVVHVVCREQDAMRLSDAFQKEKIRHLDRMAVDQDGAGALMRYLL